MTDPDTTVKEEVPQEPPPPPNAIARAVALALFMIPIGGLILMVSANSFLYGWLEVVPKITYGQACAGMTLLWLFRFFMYK